MSVCFHLYEVINPKYFGFTYIPVDYESEEDQYSYITFTKDVKIHEKIFKKDDTANFSLGSEFYDYIMPTKSYWRTKKLTRNKRFRHALDFCNDSSFYITNGSYTVKMMIAYEHFYSQGWDLKKKFFKSNMTDYIASTQEDMNKIIQIYCKTNRDRIARMIPEVNALWEELSKDLAEGNKLFFEIGW